LKAAAERHEASVKEARAVAQQLQDKGAEHQAREEKVAAAEKDLAARIAAHEAQAKDANAAIATRSATTMNVARTCQLEVPVEHSDHEHIYVYACE